MISRLSSPYLWLILATMFWGGNFAVGRALVHDVPPFTMSFIRWFIALLILLPFVWKEYHTAKELMIKQWKIIGILSLTGIAAFNSLSYVAVQYTTSINASLVNGLAPGLIILMSFIFLKERMLKIQLTGVIISLIGVLWIVTQGSIHTFMTLAFNNGDLIMLFGVLAWVIYSIYMKAAAAGLPKMALFISTIFVGLIILAPFAAWEFYRDPAPLQLGMPQVISLLYLGIFPSILSFVLWNKALLMLGPSKASVFLNFTLLFATIFSILFLHEKLLVSQVIGGILMILGVVLTANIKLFKGTRPGLEANYHHT
ncbi:DMT family transporter [Siminovitchia sediminis]|uniref:DMT family transporter n=1 Tax=Siminovitchia sediminis TaxID=1274353 RepID=A0ABW4KHW4_9BACI